MSMIQRLKERFLERFGQDEDRFYKQIKEKFSVVGNLVGVTELVEKAAQLFSDDIALIDQERILTYKELYARALSVSEKLSQVGVKSKDNVLLYCENSIEFYIFYYAIWLRGAVVVPMNTFLHEKELAYIIGDANPSAILTLSSMKPKLETLVSGGHLAELAPMITEKAISLGECDKNVKPLGLDELCLLLYTSGTTGKPKGVMLSSRNVITNAMQDYARLRMFSKQKERVFAVLPLFHVFAQNTCMWLPLLTGSSVVVVKKIDRRHITEGLQKNPTLFFGFPALFGLLCLMKTAPLESIKRFISGADAMPDKIRSAFAMIYGRKICSGYGLTEASPVVAINHDNESLPTYAVGRPLVGVECQVRDKNCQPVKIGQIGTLWVRGENVMMGYYKDSRETEKVLQDGWLNTGDVASMDAQGILSIRGRNKDLIIHKGFNIYPQEVENVLMSHPAVFKAAVVGRQEAVVGQVPVAFVATKNGQQDLEKTLRTLCANNLASYKIPRKFICVDDLPMSPTGKIDKKQLRLK